MVASLPGVVFRTQRIYMPGGEGFMIQITIRCSPRFQRFWVDARRVILAGKEKDSTASIWPSRPAAARAPRSGFIRCRIKDCGPCIGLLQH